MKKCVKCGKLFDPDPPAAPYCEDCSKLWNEMKEAEAEEARERCNRQWNAD